MDPVQKAVETQKRNIQEKTGKTFEEVHAIIQASGLAKHGEIRKMLQDTFGLGYGDANALVHYALKSDGQSAAEGLDETDVLDGIYTGKKADLRPLHEHIMASIQQLGTFEIAPKKAYLSLRRKKQFAMVGPATNDAIEIGFNAKELPEDSRLKVMPPNSMCRYTTRIKEIGEFDGDIQAWIKASFDEA